MHTCVRKRARERPHLHIYTDTQMDLHVTHMRAYVRAQTYTHTYYMCIPKKYCERMHTCMYVYVYVYEYENVHYIFTYMHTITPKPCTMWMSSHLE